MRRDPIQNSTLKILNCNSIGNYVNGFEYKTVGSTMIFDFVPTETGRFSLNSSTGTFEYIYDLKVHLGNVENREMCEVRRKHSAENVKI